MTTRIYYVPNRPTHHVLRWLSMHDVEQVDKLIAKAFDRAYDRHAAAEFERWDSYAIVTEELSALLVRWLESRAENELTSGSDPNAPSIRRGLLAPLLDDAIGEIDFLSLADALLRLRGKFAPADPRCYPFTSAARENLDRDDETDLT